MAKFETYRMMLSPPTIGPLLDGHVKPEPDQPRRDYLRSVFSRRQDFFHKGRQMVYMPSPGVRKTDDRLSGFVGRKATQRRGGGPETLFVETKTETWRASFVAVDVSPDKQIAFFEVRSDVGSGRRIIEAMFEHAMKTAKSLVWHVDVEYLWETGDFWKAADMYKGEITELAFTFAPPNGLKGFDEFKKFDRLAKKEANAHQSDYVLKNSEGAIVPAGDFVESAVDYASEGGGEAVMKHGLRKLFSSRRSKKVEFVPETLMPRQRQLPKIRGLMGYLFGRRKADNDD